MATETWYPQAVRLPIKTQEYFNPRGMSIEAIVDHVTDGTDSRDYLQYANNGSSVHFLVRLEDGKGVVYQFMPLEWGAWANGTFSENNKYMPAWVRAKLAQGINANRFTVSIEHERKWPFTTPYPEPMLEASIALHKWLADTLGIKRDIGHVLGHYQFDHVRRPNCPGGPGGALFPFERIVAALNEPTTPPINPLITVPQFQDFYLKEPRALELFGLPLEASKQEVLSDGNTYTVQYFQRSRFELHGTAVLLGLLGVEVLSSK